MAKRKKDWSMALLSFLVFKGGFWLRKDKYTEDELSIVRVVATITAYLILFGVPFGIGILIGHFCW